MYPSRVPVLYVLTLLAIALVLMLGIYVGTVVLHEPLSLLLVLGLNFLPEFPLVPNPEPEEEEDPGYEGAPETREAGFGFNRKE